MSFKVITKLNPKKEYDTFVTVYYEGKIENFCTSEDKESSNIIKQFLKRDNFTGKAGQTCTATYLKDNKLINTLFIGAGKKSDFDRDEYRITLYSALKNLSGDVCFYSPEETLNDVHLLADVINNINYDFNKYKEEKDRHKPLHMDFYTTKKVDVSETVNVLQGVNLAKDLVNEQANVITPKKLADLAISYGKEFGFEVEILDEKKAEKLGMTAFLAVGRASHNRPYVIVMRYFGDKKKKYVHGLVGKGITFDTGGLCLKPNASMLTMKDDMGGAASVLGIMSAVASNKLKKNVVAVIAACENAIGSNAYRPSDVLKTMNGKYIEVVNTDAEGRITLADAVTYIQEIEKVDEIIDLATLTGAVVTALGYSATGAFTNNDAMLNKINVASHEWGERFWHMPIFKDHHKQIKSDIASIKNSAGRHAGASTAAAFIETFIEKGTPWVHLDIAGTANLDNDTSFNKKGATGVAVRTLYSYIKGC